MSIHNQALSTKPTSLWSYLGHILTAPYKGFAKLVQDPRRLRLGLEAVLFVAIGYSVAVSGLA
jgi:hypothetical protein